VRERFAIAQAGDKSEEGGTSGPFKGMCVTGKKGDRAENRDYIKPRNEWGVFPDGEKKVHESARTEKSLKFVARG